MTKTEQNIYNCVRFTAGLGDDGTFFYHPQIATAEAASRRGLLRRLTRSSYPPRYRVTARGLAWLPVAMAAANDLRAEQEREAGMVDRRRDRTRQHRRADLRGPHARQGAA